MCASKPWNEHWNYGQLAGIAGNYAGCKNTGRHQESEGAFNHTKSPFSYQGRNKRAFSACTGTSQKIPRNIPTLVSSFYTRCTPVVPHKAVAEASKIKHYRRGELLWCMDGRVDPLMDRKVVGVVFFGMVAMVAAVTSPTTAGCSVV